MTNVSSVFPRRERSVCAGLTRDWGACFAFFRRLVQRAFILCCAMCGLSHPASSDAPAEQQQQRKQEGAGGRRGGGVATRHLIRRPCYQRGSPSVLILKWLTPSQLRISTGDNEAEQTGVVSRLVSALSPVNHKGLSYQG